MFVFDIFKQDDRRMQVVAWVVAGGMALLLAGLWYVQVVRSKHFRNDLQRQTFRHVRTPAIRGRILDRNGLPLAEERPRYNAILYLEDLQSRFSGEFARMTNDYARAHPEALNSKGRLILSKNMRSQLHLDADCAVVGNITSRVSASLEEPRLLNTNAFWRHYTSYPYVPFQMAPDLTPKQVAIFAEQWTGQTGIELETQPARVYPHHSLASHLLGYVQRRDPAGGGGQFSFDMPDYQGVSGVELVYEEDLHGQPGDKSVLINNLNYRQREEIETPNLPGDDIYLTIDLLIQRAAEQALAGVAPDVRGAVVVMDPRSGDILAMASAPSFDPNLFSLGPMTRDESERLNDPKYTPQFNRAVTGAYPPGSTFKIITSIACLESGLDPNEVFNSPGEYRASATARPIRDTAAPGPYDFERAFYRSCNTYFIEMGLRKAGLRKILEVARRFHLGQKTGISTRQEVAGDIPSPDNASAPQLFSTPDICIGQEITATPLQMACMISVIANGGTLYSPRVVSHARSSETGQTQVLVEPARVRDHVKLDPHHLAIIRNAMLADTEHGADSMGPGSAYIEFHRGTQPSLGNFRVAGKTGTAEIKSAGSHYRRVTWFDSYGPFEDPRYVVVVVVEDGSFGGPTCAPVAEKIYEAILKREQTSPERVQALARN